MSREMPPTSEVAQQLINCGLPGDFTTFVIGGERESVEEVFPRIWDCARVGEPLPVHIVDIFGIPPVDRWGGSKLRRVLGVL